MKDMGESKRGLVTAQDLWPDIKRSLMPIDFVTNSAVDMLVPTIPKIVQFALTKSDSEKLAQALDYCKQISGIHGERVSVADAMNDPKFRMAAEEFKKITGINIKDVFDSASESK